MFHIIDLMSVAENKEGGYYVLWDHLIDNIFHMQLYCLSVGKLLFGQILWCHQYNSTKNAIYGIFWYFGYFHLEKWMTNECFWWYDADNYKLTYYGLVKQNCIMDLDHQSVPAIGEYNELPTEKGLNMLKLYLYEYMQHIFNNISLHILFLKLTKIIIHVSKR